MGRGRFRLLLCFALVAGLSLLPAPGRAQIAKEEENDPLAALAFSDDKLTPPSAAEDVEDLRSVVAADVQGGWDAFRLDARGEWKASVDKRSGRVDFVEGAGVPWIPGRGNHLTSADIAGHLRGASRVDLATLESVAGGFLPKVARLLGVDPRTLVLNRERSGPFSDYLWYVEYDVTRGGLPIDGARVVFRVNNGNLIQFGTENLPPANARTPQVKITRKQALANLASYIGGFHAWDTFLDGGSLHLVPVAVEDARFADGFETGHGRGLAAVWQLTFRRGDEGATWQARVDATTGAVREFVDTNRYAQINGGVFPQSAALGNETVEPMPYANLSSGGYVNSAGVYAYTGNFPSSTLAGQYVRISDNCGAISLGSDYTGYIRFGTSGGTDCSTPGFGGAGNTHSARTQFYYLNRIKEVGRGWLPGNAWLGAQLTANVNISLTCNAAWNGSTVNFYRSGGGCNNSGEVAGVSLHEYGHGLDSNDGNGGTADNGTGETYGDFTSTLMTHDSCLGPGFRSTNCGGYGDSCTACTGIRDIDWAKHSSATPHTVANFTQLRCFSSSYHGPCGREGHCESYVSSEALWDIAARDLPNPGTAEAWTTAERLWYLSRSTSTTAFTCNTSNWTSNGCSTGSLWRTLRAADDDDGNLANGTPHGGALLAAFNRHGIACSSDAGAGVTFRACAPPAVPTASAEPGSNQAVVSWNATSGVYDVYRSDVSCDSGLVKIANDIAPSPLRVIDDKLANGQTYYYRVVAQPSGNEACMSAPSACQSVTAAGKGHPFEFSSVNDERQSCYGIAGHDSTACDSIADFNDRQMCYGMAQGSQTPCTTMTDRNMQLACYGMSIKWSSNCRDITDLNQQRFCYGVSGNPITDCTPNTERNAQLLCYGMNNGIYSNCSDITDANDRNFCYGVSAHDTQSCSFIQ
jgi:hypothetical protein